MEQRLTLRPLGARLYHRGSFWLAQLVPLLAWPGVASYHRRRRRLAGDTRYARFARAGRSARTEIAKARAALAGGETAGCRDIVAAAIRDYLAAKLDLPAAVEESAASRLQAAGVDAPAVDRVRGFFAACEHARFAPGAVTRTDIETTLAQAEAILRDLERTRRIKVAAVVSLAIAGVALATGMITHAAATDDNPTALFFRAGIDQRFGQRHDHIPEQFHGRRVSFIFARWRWSVQPPEESAKSTAQFNDQQTGTISGGIGWWLDQHITQTTAEAKATWIAGHHTVRSGFAYREKVLSDGYFTNLLIKSGDTTYATEVWASEGTTRNRIPSVFLQDTREVSDKLTLNARLRWDGQYFVGSDGRVHQKILGQYQPRVGFVLQDLDEIKASLERNWEEGRFTRGASTITQQLAKNLYLSPSRNPVRKLRELFITRRLEASLTKRRILEIYLNVIEWGDGIFGCEAAARAYFGKGAADLSREEAALMAGAIINPRELRVDRPNNRLLRGQQIVLRRMGGAE